MKVLIVNTFYYPHEVGGAEKSVRILAEELVKKGCDVTILALSDDGVKNIEYINDVKIQRVPIMNLYVPGLQDGGGSGITGKLKKLFWHFFDYYNVVSYFYLSKIINEDFDIVHTNNVSGFSVAVWNVARKKNIPIVHTSRDYYLFNPNCTMYSNGENEQPDSLKIKLLSYVKKIQSRKVDAYVGISHFIHDLHIEHGFFPKALFKQVIYNSIGSNFIDNDRESFYRDDEGVRFGYLGRLDSAKGIENIIDYLKTVDLNFTLMIAGKGNASFVEKLKRKCSQDPRFIFIGQTEISIFFKKIDCLICPSIWNEPMGRVVIESFSYGIPVIGNNVGGIGELINSGKTGFLFDIKSRDSFIDAINNYNSTEYGYLSRNCIECSKEFTDEIYVDRYMELYNSLLSYKSIR